MGIFKGTKNAETTGNRIAILVAETHVRRLVQLNLEKSGFELVFCSSDREVRQVIQPGDIKLAILGNEFEGEIAQYLRDAGIKVIVIPPIFDSNFSGPLRFV